MWLQCTSRNAICCPPRRRNSWWQVSRTAHASTWCAHSNFLLHSPLLDSLLPDYGIWFAAESKAGCHGGVSAQVKRHTPKGTGVRYEGRNALFPFANCSLGFRPPGRDVGDDVPGVANANEDQ